MPQSDYSGWTPSSTSRFDWSAWRPAPVDPGPPLPPPDPAVLQQQRIIDTTTAQDALNNYINAKNQALYEGPDAFYGKQGADAVQAAPGMLDTLKRMRKQALDGMDNDAQRRKLGGALDAHMDLDRDDIARHVAAQSLAWQRQVAQNRIDALNKGAALQHNDDGLVDAMGNAAAGAARAQLRAGGVPADPEAEDAAAATAKSGVFRAAIQAHLDRGNTEGAAGMFDHSSDRLDPEHAAELGAQIATGQRLQAAKDYALQFLPAAPASSAEEIEAQRETALKQAEVDHPDDPERHMLAQHHINIGFDSHRNALDQANADRATAVQRWLTTPDADGKPQTSLPPAELWNKLSPDEKVQLLAQLRSSRRSSDIVQVKYNPNEVIPVQSEGSPTSPDPAVTNVKPLCSRPRHVQTGSFRCTSDTGAGPSYRDAAAGRRRPRSDGKTYRRPRENTQRLYGRRSLECPLGLFPEGRLGDRLQPRGARLRLPLPARV